MSQTFCEQCGEQVSEGARFCKNCGHPVSPVSPPTPSTQPPPQYQASQHPAPYDPTPPTPSEVQPVQKDRSGFAIACLVVGVAGLAIWLTGEKALSPFLVILWLIFVPLAGIVLGMRGFRSSYRWMAVVGIILNVIQLIMGIWFSVQAVFLL